MVIKKTEKLCVALALLIRVRVKIGLAAYAQVVDSKNVFSSEK